MNQKAPNWQPDHLQNVFVRLEPLTESDFERLYEVASDPLIWEQHPSADRYQRPVFLDFFKDALASGTAFLIVDAPTDTLIGSTRFYDHNAKQCSISIGYTFLAREYWGGSYNRAAKKLLLDYAFGFVDQVYFHIGAGNRRSQLAVSKLGAKKSAEEYRDRNGIPQLHFEYCLNKEDWKG